MNLVEKDAIYLRQGLDVLFVALNPPSQSNGNGHYFSGRQSLFFSQLFQSGLITVDLDKRNADEFVFGKNIYNFNYRQFGIIDLIPSIVQTDSSKIKILESNIALLVKRIVEFSPNSLYNSFQSNEGVSPIFEKASTLWLLRRIN